MLDLQTNRVVQVLEHIYGALDEDGVGPEPTGQAGVAA
jgi:hypothetical protein